jgi:hypothetical protein
VSRRKPKDKGQNAANGTVPGAVTPGAPGGSVGANSKTISLHTGNGALTLTVSFDAITLSASDRKFIFDLIDKLNKYEEKGTQAST